ncbi:tetratricopeptide repeat protein [Reichenbachiella agarivorans]|uniref:Tetratricopeptide repeat protein n=1 Tax=Reichenbachiella agarivorans TaxID=2979464 RepID=A0ABY6CM37_9BACT|nr:tetratricopeptide repeat protein [Reichenbachiella agarivorans]UXP31578.1 tetratricopeptide repeat protein [Reichenbachiella agarivorans]
MNTKKLFVFVIALMMSVASFAQKGSVTKADAYLAKNDLVSAKAEIDVAITIEKNATKSKTWFSRGKIYQAIATSEDESTKAIDPQALTKAVEAYNKVLSMDKETSSYALISTTNLDQMWGTFLNAGGTAYGEEDYNMALNQFEKALVVKENDSTTLFYSGVAAQQSGKVDKTLMYYYKMMDLGIANEDIYSTVIYYERQAENSEKALEVTRAAKEKFPKDSRFGQEEISLLLAMDKLDEAKSQLEKAIAADPTNVNLHLNLGVLYDNLGASLASANKKEEARASFDKAKESYLNALKIDPDNYIANFNAGVIYVNLAKEYYDEVRDMDYKSYQKYGEAKTKKADVILKQGLPYMEKAISIKPDDVDGLKALQQMYTQLKMNDKAEAIYDRVEALEGAE